MHLHNTLPKIRDSVMLIFSNPMATILFPLTRTQWYLPMALPLVSRLFMQPIHRLLSKIVILLTLIIRAMVKHLQCLLNKVNIPNPVCQSTWPQPTLPGKPHMSRKPTRHDCLGLLTTSSICLSTTQSWTTPFSFLIFFCFPRLLKWQTLSVSFSLYLPGCFSGENGLIHCVFFLLNFGMEK